MKYYTHAGKFHADEVLGYAITTAADICTSFVRLEDITNIPNDGLVADIGRQWNETNLKFDHHQGFFPRENGVPYASAGMLWKAYGEEICGSKEVAERVDEIFIQGVDAHDADNSYAVSATCSAGEVRAMTFSNIISSFNSDDIRNAEKQNASFILASELAENTLVLSIESAKKFIEGKNRFSKLAKVRDQIITLSEYVPWQEIVEKDYPNALYVISPSGHPGNPVSLTAVPVKAGSRELKMPIERPHWFENFIHQGKWIAGCESVEEARRLATSQFSISR